MPADLATGIEDRRGAIAPLPSNVHYACIKRFLLELPSPMTTLPLMAAPTAHDAAWRALAGKTFRTVDRLLRQREAALAQRPIDESEARRTVTALRGQWIHHLLAELLWHATGRLWVATRLTRGRGPKLSMRSVAHVEVWTLKGKGPRLLERRTIVPTVKHWAGDSVDHFDLDAVHLALAEVLRTYARDLFGRRCGTRWRSRRRRTCSNRVGTPSCAHVADSSNGKCRTTAKTSGAFSGGSAELIRATQLPDPPVAAALRDRHHASPGGTQVQRHKALAFRFQRLSSVTFESCFHSLVRTGQGRLIEPPEPFDATCCERAFRLFLQRPTWNQILPAFVHLQNDRQHRGPPVHFHPHSLLVEARMPQMVTRRISARQSRPPPRARSQRAAARAPRARGACRVRGPSRRAPS